ncbi:hypothetical protein LPJ59_001307 [Coemansia sp. RSA 2399]|nr:hypothetical protein LPJ59_001307 [Coemansia sp. RSA 2399]
MLAVERYSFAMSVTTLAATAVFGVLDLGGMVVLRSSKWRMSFFLRGGEGKGGGIYDRSGGWHAASSLDLPSKLMGGDWLYHADGNVYGTGSRPLASWRRWAFLEELIFGFRRNMGFIRLSIALLLALLWSPAIVQVAIVGYAGQCHMAVSGDGPSAVAGGGGGGARVAALDVCDLLRKALITSVFIWAAWSLMALLLLFVNTTSTGVVRASKHLMPYHIPIGGGGGGGGGGHRPLSVGGLVPGTAGGAGNDASVNASISGGYPGTGALFSSKRNSNTGNMVYAGGQMPYNQGLFHPYQQIHHPYASAAPSTMGPKDFSTAQYRASWSHTDGGESVISSDVSRLETQNIFHSQNNKHMLLQSQPSTVHHQLYHLHPFHSLNQFQPPSRISEEQQAAEGNGDLYANLPSSLALAYSSAQRKARAAFYKTKYSTSISGGMADPLVNTAGSSVVHAAAASSTTHGVDGGAGDKMLSRDGAQRHYKLQHRHHGGGPLLPAGVLPAGAEKGGAAARSLARLSYESCDGALAIAASLGGGTNGGGGGWRSSCDSKTKRNTIG